MKTLNNHYTPEQEELLKSNIPLRRLAGMSIFKGRTIKGLYNKRRDLTFRELGEPIKRNRKQTFYNPQEQEVKGYDGKRVKLYQFITTAQATPERTKEWKDMNETERRRMHQETLSR